MVVDCKKTINRVVIFVHFNKNNLIDPYVFYYLEQLSSVCDYIIFASTSCISQDDNVKLLKYANKVIIRNNEGYDFFSYKVGYDCLCDLTIEYKELLLVNDSCIGPLYSLQDVFNTMDCQEIDFWGITKNQNHVQSYFLLFKKPVLESSVFIDFWKKFLIYQTKTEVIKNGEIKLTQDLISFGFKYEAYIKNVPQTFLIFMLKAIRVLFNRIFGSSIFGVSIIFMNNNMYDNTSIFWDILIKRQKMPFLKKSVLRRKDINMNKLKSFIRKYTKYSLINIDSVTK